MDLFDLVAKLTLDSSEYENGLDQAENKGSNFGKNLAKAAKVGGVALAAVGTAAAATGAAFVKNAGSIAAYGDNIDKMSQKMGMTAEAYQEWDAVMQHSGTSIETMKASMKTLANAVESGNEAFSRIGLTQEELANMSQEDIFEATITGLQNVEDTTERTYLAGQLLGRGATELGALLNTSAEETQAMRDRVHELGGVMSDDAVKASAQFQDNLQDMKTAISGVSRSIFSEFIPGLSSLMAGFTALLAGDEDAQEVLGKGVDNLLLGLEKMTQKIPTVINKLMPAIVKAITTALPMLAQGGISIIQGLVSAIIQNLPMMMNGVMAIMDTLVTQILDNLPLIVEVALQLIVTLADGLVEALPELVPRLVEVITEIVTILTDPQNLGMLVNAAIAIIMALAQGLIQALPQLIQAIPVIVDNLVTSFVTLAPQLIPAAVELILQLAAGLIQAIPELVAAVPEIIGSLISGIASWNKNLKTAGEDVIIAVGEGVEEFIDNALTWGADLIDNFVSGINKGIGKVKNAAADVGNAVKDFLGFSEPDEGPLSNFHTYAPDMIDLFVKGIKDNVGEVEDVLGSTFKMPEVAMADNTTTANGVGFGGVTIPIYIGQERIDEIVINALDMANYKAGGR